MINGVNVDYKLHFSSIQLRNKTNFLVCDIIGTESLYGCETIVGAGCCYCPADDVDVVLGHDVFELYLTGLDIFGEMAEDGGDGETAGGGNVGD